MSPAATATIRQSSAVASGTEPLLDVRDLCKYFPIRAGLLGRTKEWVKAVDKVSFQIPRGTTLALVGESGCGKTTVGRSLLRLIKPTAGQVFFEGEEITTMPSARLRSLRQKMQIIFQDPFGSLNPRMTVGKILGEPLMLHQRLRGEGLKARLEQLCQQVGLKPAALSRYPHEFSGGQRQRIGIARALALHPSFIVCDEPTSALDVSIRAQIINLLQDLQQEQKLSYLMISHDLGVVRQISQSVAVMYLGKIVEQAPTDTLYGRASHPYTRVLMSAIPVINPRQRAGGQKRLRTMDKDDSVPSPVNLPPGCPFHPRCPLYASKGQPEQCRTQHPQLVPLSTDASHLVSCHFAEEAAGG